MSKPTPTEALKILRDSIEEIVAYVEVLDPESLFKICDKALRATAETEIAEVWEIPVLSREELAYRIHCQLRFFEIAEGYEGHFAACIHSILTTAKKEPQHD